MYSVDRPTDMQLVSSDILVLSTDLVLVFRKYLVLVFQTFYIVFT